MRETDFRHFGRYVRCPAVAFEMKDLSVTRFSRVQLVHFDADMTITARFD